MRLKSLGTAVLALVLAGCGPPEPLRVGFLAGLTGPVSELGLGARRGLELAVRDFNRSGGLRGRSVELVVADDGNQPAEGLAGFARLRAQGVVAVVGPVTSTVMAAVLPFLNEHHIPTVSPTVSAVSVSGRDDWFFRVITGNAAMGRVLGDYAVESGFREVAVLRETSNDAFTGPVLAEARSRIEASGAVVREPVEFDMRDQPDFARLAAALGDAPAYLVLTNGYDAALVGQRLARAGHLAPVLSPPWAMTPDVISLGGRQVERMVFVSVYDSQSQNPAWREFREAYRGVYGEEPGFAAVYAADAFRLLTEALKLARSTQPDDVRKALAEVGEIQGLQSPFRLDATGDVVRDLFLLTVRDGQFVHQQP